MLGAIYIGLSGMNAYSKGLQTISNNVGNMNSPGFKATSVSFRDVFNHGGSGGLTYLGSPQSHQTGGGVRFGDPRIDFKQGDLRQSNGDLDLAIKGNGFLILTDGDKTYYGRTGTFVIAEDGYIVQDGTQNRLAVLDSTGKPAPLNIDNKRSYSAVASTTIKFGQNLSSTDTDGALIQNITVNDRLGVKQVWQVQFTQVGVTGPGAWKVAVSNQAGAIGETQLRFIGQTVHPSTEKLVINGKASDGTDMPITLDFSTGVTSQSGGTTSSLAVSSVDGNAFGSLTTVVLDDNGKIKVNYSNGKNETLGAVALADFRDPQKLERIGNGLFENKASGQVRIMASGEEGIGKLLSKQVEASNVDLSQEFGDLILIQRGFQASSQVVSVSNDMIQQLFGIRGQG